METNEKKFVIFESIPFLFILTFIGGFINAYSYITRGGLFPTAHTGDVTKVGIYLALGNWDGLVSSIILLTASLLGATFSQFLKLNKRTHILKGDWRKTALLIEIILLTIIGLIPQTVSNIVVNMLLSFIAGYQLSLFRTWNGSAHNTTICTGNLRTLGQLLYDVIASLKKNNLIIFLKYFCLLFSFAIGSFVGTLLSNLFSIHSIWFISLLAIISIIQMQMYDTKMLKNTTN